MISGHIYEHEQIQVLSRGAEHPQVRENAPVWTLKLACLYTSTSTQEP